MKKKVIRGPLRLRDDIYNVRSQQEFIPTDVCVVQPNIGPKHGTQRRYCTYGCRCQLCRMCMQHKVKV